MNQIVLIRNLGDLKHLIQILVIIIQTFKKILTKYQFFNDTNTLTRFEVSPTMFIVYMFIVYMCVLYFYIFMVRVYLIVLLKYFIICVSYLCMCVNKFEFVCALIYFFLLYLCVCVMVQQEKRERNRSCNIYIYCSHLRLFTEKNFPKKLFHTTEQQKCRKSGVGFFLNQLWFLDSSLQCNS